jgi:DNA-binding transcriptional MerR regulator
LNQRLRLLHDLGRTVLRNPQDGGHLRPIDLAREHGLSTQAIRNYEADGILPDAQRTNSGYRTYTPLHAQALRAFLALLPGHGHQTATLIMQAINRGTTEEAFRLIDESHAQSSTTAAPSAPSKPR